MRDWTEAACGWSADRGRSARMGTRCEGGGGEAIEWDGRGRGQVVSGGIWWGAGEGVRVGRGGWSIREAQVPSSPGA